MVMDPSCEQDGGDNWSGSNHTSWSHSLERRTMSNPPDIEYPPDPMVWYGSIDENRSHIGGIQYKREGIITQQTISSNLVWANYAMPGWDVQAAAALATPRMIFLSGMKVLRKSIQIMLYIILYHIPMHVNDQRCEIIPRMGENNLYATSRHFLKDLLGFFFADGSQYSTPYLSVSSIWW